MSDTRKDVVIIGSGPAGLSAAVYAKRALLDVAVIEKEMFSGGQIVTTDRVDNLLGFYGTNGYDLSVKFREHADALEVPFMEGTVTDIANQEDYKEVHLEDGSVIEKINPLLSSLGLENVTIDDICVGGDDANNTLVGYVVLVTSSEGYGGDIQIAVGMDTDYKITGLSFLTLNETAGLGMEADTDAFKQQFIGKSVDQFTYTKTGSTQDSEIDALSGATITTSAVTNAVNAALRTIQYLTAGGAQ